MMFRVHLADVPGTRNTRKPCQYRNVQGVPGVPGLHARVRVHKRAYIARAHTKHIFPRVHTRNTRNTRNKQVTMRVSDVPGTRNIKEGTRNMEKKPMRVAMPTVAAFIDDLREAFGAEMINAAIRAGMDGQQTF